MSGRASNGSSPRPFEGHGHWLNEPWDQSELTHEMRCERLRSRLRGYKIHLPDEYIEVLAHCGSMSEVWFIYESFLHLSGWRQVGERSLGNGLYRLTVKESFGGDRADLLVEDNVRDLKTIFEIQGPLSYLPGKVAAEKARQRRLRSKVDHLYLVEASKARSVGKSFRKDLIREQISRMRNQQVLERPVETANLRIWHGSDLGYDVTEISYGDRIPLVKDWIKTRGLSEVPDEVGRALAYCDRAGEVLLVMQMLTLPRYSVAEDCRSISFHDLYRLLIQPEVGGHKVDFVIEPITPRASRGKSVLEVNPPPHHPRDVRTDEITDRELFESGYQVYRTPADKAKWLGYRWREIIAFDATKDQE